MEISAIFVTMPTVLLQFRLGYDFLAKNNAITLLGLNSIANFFFI